MPIHKAAFLNASAASAMMLLTACDTEQRVVEVAVIGKADSASMNAANRSPAGQLLRGAVADGLVGLDQQGQVIPALADRWIVADDGLSYIFRLRASEWPDGTAINAASVQAGLRQVIAAQRGTPLALDLAAISEIRVMTGRVIELRLSQPVPELLTLLAQPELSLLRKGRGAGPMRLSREGSIATLVPIAPEKRGLTAVANWQARARTLRLVALPPAEAIERFSAGKVLVVLGGTLVDLPAGDLPGAIRFDSVPGLFGLLFAHSDGFLSDAANREAIAMAIDREALLAGKAVPGWTPSYRPIPSGQTAVLSASAQSWVNQSLPGRQAAASARVAKWRGSKDAPQLRIAVPAGPGAAQLYQSLADSLKQIGLDAVRVGMQDRADLRLLDTVATYPRAGWYFNQLHCSNQRGLCSAAADKLTAEAAVAPDAAKQAELIAQAEMKLTEAHVFIPFGPPVRWSLVRNGTTGFAPNRLGYHPLMPLALLPK